MGDDGISLFEIMTLANKSNARNKIIILDSCHSGVAGDHPNREDVAELTKGVTVLTASTASQYASEKNGSGVFTSLFVNALNGAASNLVGEITPGAVYAHIDQSLGPWSQRPVFKTNVESFVSLRTVEPPLPLNELRQICEFFPTKGFKYQLDPSYEPERPAKEMDLPSPDPLKTPIFAILQKYNRVGILVPEGMPPHMWHAAIHFVFINVLILCACQVAPKRLAIINSERFLSQARIIWTLIKGIGWLNIPGPADWLVKFLKRFFNYTSRKLPPSRASHFNSTALIHGYCIDQRSISLILHQDGSGDIELHYLVIFLHGRRQSITGISKVGPTNARYVQDVKILGAWKMPSVEDLREYKICSKRRVTAARQVAIL